MEVTTLHSSATGEVHPAAYKAKTVPAFKYYRSSSEHLIAERALRQRSVKREVSYEFTKDAGLLHQYYILRENMFINVWGLKGFTAKEDMHDRYSHILLAREGNHVTGGMRLTVKPERSLRRLPLENDEVNVEKMFPEMNLKEHRYAEVSKFAVLPDARTNDLLLSLVGYCIERAVNLGVSYLFTVCPKPLARCYKTWSSTFGAKGQIRQDIVIPDREEFEGIPMVMLVIDLREVVLPYNCQEVVQKAAKDGLI